MNGGRLLADTVWWGGLRTPAALRWPVAGGAGPDAPARRLPGALLPGLRDAHVHTALVDLAAVRAGGIAAVCDLGGDPAVVARLAAGGPGLPAVTFAGAFLTAPGGYPSDRAWAPPGSWREVRSVADAGDAVAEQRSAGASLVKVAANTTAGPVLAEPVLRAVVAAAHAAGLPVVVHAEGPGTVRQAYEAGADQLAHTPWTEPLDDALIRAAAAAMTWISTLDIHGAGSPEQEVAVGNLRRFLANGGRVRYGTDLGNGPLPTGVNPREIAALQAAGMSPEDVLAAMTEPAEPGDLCWLPDGLDLTPARFAACLAGARVLDPAAPDPAAPDPAV